jgi:hypothetical protein
VNRTKDPAAGINRPNADRTATGFPTPHGGHCAEPQRRLRKKDVTARPPRLTPSWNGVPNAVWNAADLGSEFGQLIRHRRPQRRENRRHLVTPVFSAISFIGFGC